MDLLSANLIVAPGDGLALTLRSEAIAGGYGWAFGLGDPYAGGHGHFRADNPGTGPFLVGGADQFFKTFVDSSIPEPSTFLLMGIGAVGFMRNGRGQRHQ